jgi:hypothetical protein
MTPPHEQESVNCMARGTAGKIDDLLKDMPFVFEQPPSPAELFDDLVVVPIDNPEWLPTDWSTQAPLGELDEVAAERSDEEITAEQLEAAIAESLGNTDINAGPLDGLAGRISGSGPGGPIDRSRFPGMPPPPDALAFYLQFHYYAPTWWGVYLTVEGVQLTAQMLVSLSKGKLPPSHAVTAARLFLYYHEAFHHNVECFATRLELAHRKPLYVDGFQSFFSRVFGTDRCLEEGLANAYAYTKTTKKVRHARLPVAIRKMIWQSPPGYRLGVRLAGRFEKEQAKLAEQNFRECFPWARPANDRVWKSMGHLFDGVSNIRGRVNYIVNRRSPLIQRARLRPLLSPTKLIRKLQSAASLSFVRHGANHDVYRAANGATVPIPRHPRDISKGTLLKILREAGIDLSLSEFLAS